MKRLVGLLVFAALWIPSAWLGLHDIGKQEHIQEFTVHVSARTVSADSSFNDSTYAVSGTLTDAVYSFHASCGSALFPAGGFNGGPSTKQVTNYPIRQTRAGEPAAVLAEAEAVNDALGEQQFDNVYTPPVQDGPTLPSLTDQVATQQQKIADTCHQNIVTTRWEAFFACPVGWIPFRNRVMGL
jgi:hypothetical protein